MGGEGIGSGGIAVVIEAFSQTVRWWRSDAVGILDLVGMAKIEG